MPTPLFTEVSAPHKREPVTGFEPVSVCKAQPVFTRASARKSPAGYGTLGGVTLIQSGMSGVRSSGGNCRTFTSYPDLYEYPTVHRVRFSRQQDAPRAF